MLVRRIAPFAIAALTVAVFAPALHYGFILWDDDRNLLTNPFYRGLGWAQIRWAFTSAVMGDLGLLSKSLIMSLPLVLLVLDVYPLRRARGNWRRVLVGKLPYLGLAVTAAVVSVLVVIA